MLTLLEEKREALISQVVTKGLDPNVPLKPSGIEWLGDIPEHWEVSRAKFVSEIFVPQRNKPELNLHEGICWLTMEDMRTKRIKETRFTVNQDALNLAGSKILKKYAVIASCVGNFGVCSINDMDVVINQQLQAFIPYKDIIPEYLYNLVLISKPYFEMIATAATLVYVNQLGFANMPVILPSLKEQKQIIDYLNCKTAEIDKLRSEINKSIELLKERRSALITAAVTGKIEIEEMKK
jgi:type I restriction enzyme, S subunit